MMDDETSAEDDPIWLDWQTVRRTDPVERVARALCKFDGREPDSVASSDRTEPFVTEDGIAVLRSIEEPAWKKYVREASRLVAAFRAFTGPEGGD
ncbi:hypothetical protein MKK69_01115 [Methylobacterium sp. J-026]|uniref:hypothetical protein n=1 Tax=Methylobacterium sp. J-026 TaxID=2836624 RepID=UPI001FB9879D|nr:hypothetical protein [Methylobacterium sp. J-026]MCJ2132680.1 hypothetical protein [Methylobacterium sp. J-026]